MKEPTLPIKEFSDLFAKVERKKEGKMVSSNSMQKIKQQVVHLLARTRSQAVGIFLSSLHVEVDEIKQCLYNVDTAILDYQTLKALYEIVS